MVVVAPVDGVAAAVEVEVTPAGTVVVATTEVDGAAVGAVVTGTAEVDGTVVGRDELDAAGRTVVVADEDSSAAVMRGVDGVRGRPAMTAPANRPTSNTAT